MLATAKQVAFLTTLATERQHDLGADRIAQFSKAEASRWISTLMSIPRPAKAVTAATSTTTTVAAEPLEVGMYRTASGDIFKVQESKESGNRYAKKLTPIGGQRLTETDETVSFEFVYAPGAIKSLTAAQRMTLDEAKAFGIRYGVCCVCGITLRDAKSVANGIGPICITKI